MEHGRFTPRSGPTVDRTETTVTYTGSDNNNVTYTGDKNQLIAYYMEVVNIDNENGESELHVNAADWGTKGDGSGDWGYTPERDRCSVSIQLVYEDGSLNPLDTTAGSLKSKTIIYGYWNGGRKHVCRAHHGKPYPCAPSHGLSCRRPGSS